MEVRESRSAILVIVCILTIAFAALVWSLLGSSGTSNSENEYKPSTNLNATGSIDSSSKQVASIDSLVDQLHSRLKLEGGDVNEWILLAKSYQHLNRSNEMTAALEQARTLGFKGELNSPNPPSAYPPGYRLAAPPTLTKYLQRQFLNGALAKAADSTGSEGSHSLRVTVAASAEIESHISENDTLFIFAKPGDGNPMPLAVAKLSASDLPTTIILDDSHAMTESHSLSSATEVLVAARISKSGTATRQSGDIETISNAITLADTTSIALLIDTLVE